MCSMKKPSPWTGVSTRRRRTSYIMRAVRVTSRVAVAHKSECHAYVRCSESSTCWCRRWYGVIRATAGQASGAAVATVALWRCGTGLLQGSSKAPRAETRTMHGKQAALSIPHGPCTYIACSEHSTLSACRAVRAALSDSMRHAATLLLRLRDATIQYAAQPRPASYYGDHYTAGTCTAQPVDTRTRRGHTPHARTRGHRVASIQRLASSRRSSGRANTPNRT